MDFVEQKYHFACGVPCSYFKDFLAYLTSHPTKITHIIATREDEAIGIAAGVAFSKRRAIIYMQNSGLATIGDALTSLAQLYKLPMLLLISYRGLAPDHDFPEHSLMGTVTEDVLRAYNLPYWILTEETWQHDLDIAFQEMEARQLPVVLLIKKGVLSE